MEAGALPVFVFGVVVVVILGGEKEGVDSRFRKKKGGGERKKRKKENSKEEIKLLSHLFPSPSGSPISPQNTCSKPHELSRVSPRVYVENHA